MKFLYAVLLISLVACTPNGNNKKLTEETEGIISKRYRDSVNLIRQAIQADEKNKRLDSLFRVKFSNKRFNGTVLIAQQGQIIYKKAFGFSIYEKKEPLTLNSAFQLASVSKQFTAVAIMLLKERGKLDYTDTITKFFPDFPYKNITVKSLLTHRSGLPNYMYFCGSYALDPCKPLSNQEVIDLMIKNKPACYNIPNRRFNYNNTNYCILAAIVEKVSQMSFATFMEKEVFEPLQMNHTWVSTKMKDTLFQNETMSYEPNWSKAVCDYLDGVTGDKGIYSTVEDLFKWDQALYSEKLLKQSTLEEAFTPASKELKGKRNYGYGWRTLFDEDGNKIVFHNGWWHGYNTLFFRRLNDRSTVIILSNKYNRSIYQIQDIISILDGRQGAAEELAEAGDS